MKYEPLLVPIRKNVAIPEPVRRTSFWYPNLQRLKIGDSFEIPAEYRESRTNVYQIAQNLKIKVQVRTVKGTSFVWRVG